MKIRRPPATRHPLLAAASALMLASLQAFCLSPDDARVKISCAPANAAPRAVVHMTDAGEGGQFVRASITNDSGREITLRRITVTLPWARPAGERGLICAGSWEMGRVTVCVHPAGSADKIETGSHLLSNDGAGGFAIAAFVTWKTFHSKLRWEKDALVIDADGEGRVLKPGETVQTEKIWLSRCDGSAGWQDLLFASADIIARENNVRLNRPKPYVGWATWDYYGREWTFEQVAANVEKLVEICPQADFVQIDAGWWPLRGDYMELKERHKPDGMKRIAQLARSKNLDAGIHLDGWRADVKSAIVRENPDWFLRDSAGKHIVQGKTKTSEGNFVFFDYSHPGACEYMTRVLRHIRDEWGYNYFKMDFVRHGTNEWILRDAGSKATIVPHDRSLTSVERVHRSLAAMREGMGADAYFLGCSSVFGPTFGHVDGLRTGGDIAPNLRGYKRGALNNASSFYLHGKVVHNDADYHVVRSAADQDATVIDDEGKDGGGLSLNEAWLWTHYVALCGGPRINSDNLLTLRPERQALFLFAAGFPTAERFVPLDLWAHGRDRWDPPAVILTQAKGDCYLGVFNWTDAGKTVELAGIGAELLAKIGSISGLTAGTAFGFSKKIHAKSTATADATGETLLITLPARHSVILKLPAGNFDALRRAIVVR